MAAVRERQAAAEGNVLARMWKAAGLLVTAMMLLVVLLAGTTLLRTDTQPTGQIAYGTPYSEEWDLYGDTDVGAGDLSDDQVMTIIYDDLEDVDGQGR